VRDLLAEARDRYGMAAARIQITIFRVQVDHQPGQQTPEGAPGWRVRRSQPRSRSERHDQSTAGKGSLINPSRLTSSSWFAPFTQVV